MSARMFHCYRNAVARLVDWDTVLEPAKTGANEGSCHKGARPRHAVHYPAAGEVPVPKLCQESVVCPSPVSHHRIHETCETQGVCESLWNT